MNEVNLIKTGKLNNNLKLFMYIFYKGGMLLWEDQEN